jgi:trehalose 6-phosphate phosphatase
MQELLASREGAERLDQVIGTGLLCGFDFDGTLTPIVERPEDVRMPAVILAELVTLQRLAPVAIITGRAIGDVRPRLGFEPDFLIGNHGLEGVPGARLSAAADQHRAACAAWRKQIESLLAAEYPDPGVQVEDKRFSLSLHYRHAQAPERAASQLENLLARLEPRPRIVGGKCVFNLVPQDSVDKGDALIAVMEAAGARTAIYVGDDITDEDVFRLSDGNLLSVRVERADNSSAPFYVSSFADVPRLLQTLSQKLAAFGASNWLMQSRQLGWTRNR